MVFCQRASEVVNSLTTLAPRRAGRADLPLARHLHCRPSMCPPQKHLTLAARVALNMVPALFVGLVLIVGPRSSRADDIPVRADRGVSLSLLLPDWTNIRTDGCCFPLPGLQVARHATPNVAVDLSVAALEPMNHIAFAASAGVRRYLSAGAFAPYLVGRMLYLARTPDERSFEQHLGALGGLGLEWVFSSRALTVSLEATGGGLRRFISDEDSRWMAAMRTVLSFGVRLPVKAIWM